MRFTRSNGDPRVTGNGLTGQALIDEINSALGGSAWQGGGAAQFFDFTQSTPATTWTINHNLGFFPSVEIRSTGGVEVDAQVTNTSVNQTVVTFSIPFAGTARLN